MNEQLYVQHTFGPGQTIKAVIRHHNCYVDDEKLLNELYDRFKKINPNKVPKVGDVFKIPLLDFKE